MRIVVLTQNDPFYLAEHLGYLFRQLSAPVEVAGCVIFEVSPFGKKESFLNKVIRTVRIFGLPFFMRYGFKFIMNRLIPSKRVEHVLNNYQIPKIEIEGDINSNDALNTIQEFKPDLLVSIAGNQIFQKELIRLAPKGCINLHTALLPKYRGLMPSFWVLKNDEEYTGVSVFFVDEGIDSGPILVQKKIEIADRTQEELIRDTKKMGMDAIIEAIELIRDGNYELIPNPDEEMSYYSFPTREDVKEFRRKGKKIY